MQPSARDSYQTTEVLTATPQKLQLMLIDGALRFARQAHAQYTAGQVEQAGEAVIRCQEIVAEILGGLRPDRDPQLVGRVAALYTFIFRRLTAAHAERATAPLDDVIRVLGVERETWLQVCQALGAQRHEVPAPHVKGQAFVA